MYNMLEGFAYLINGFKLIFKPGIKRFIIIPFLINMILFSVGFFVVQHFFAQFNHWLIGYLPHWLHWVSSILWIIFFCSFFLLLLFTFVAFANLIGAPFNNFLAEKVLLHLTGENLAQKTLWQSIQELPQALKRQFALLGYYLPRACGLFILLFVPVVHFFVAIAWFVFNAWFMALQYLDYPTDNQRVSLSEVHHWLWRNRGLTLGFGSGILIFTLIPVINFFIMPAAVAAATQLWHEKSR